MKAFRFSLQALLTLRQRQEQAALVQFARALRSHQLDLEALRLARLEQDATWALRRQQVPAGVSAGQLSRLHSHGLTVEERTRKCQAAAALSRRVSDLASERLLLARRQREMVDRLFEKHKRSHEHQLRLAEQKQLDELARPEPASAARMDPNPDLAWN